MKAIVLRFFINKTEETFIQFFRYLFVGGFSAIIDMGAFFVVRNILDMHYLVAQTVGFSLGLLTNYLISIAWVFSSTGKIKREFFLFVMVGLGGLLWSYLILWILIDKIGMHTFQDMLAKTITIALVLVWNFGMRKKFVF